MGLLGISLGIYIPHQPGEACARQTDNGVGRKLKKIKGKKETPTLLPTRTYTVCSEVVRMVVNPELTNQAVTGVLWLLSITPENRTPTEWLSSEKEMV